MVGRGLDARPVGAGPADDPDGGPSSWGIVGAVVRDRRVWAIGLVSLFLNPFDEPFVGFTIALLERERGASAGVATVVAFIGVSGGLVAFTVLARRFRHVPDSRLLSGAAA